jgi:hypothetical protein
MKTLGRILIILIAAFVVIGAVYAFSQTAAAQTLTGNAAEMGPMEDRPAPSTFTNDQSILSNQLGSRPEGGGEGRGDLQTLGQNLLKIAAIVAAVQVLWLIGRWMKLAAELALWRVRGNPSCSS